MAELPALVSESAVLLSIVGQNGAPEPSKGTLSSPAAALSLIRRPPLVSLHG